MTDLPRWVGDCARICALVFFVILAGAVVFFLVGLIIAPNPALGALTGWLVAGAALLFNAWQYGQKAENDRSRFALDMAMEGVRRAHGILTASEPASRIEWINAGRILARAMRMSKDIRAEDHNTAWELFREEWRIKFLYFLRRSPEYYMGLPEPSGYEQQKVKNYGDDKLIELLKKTAIETEFNMTRSHSSSSANSYLSETAIKVVHDFAEYDESWNDPLDTIEGFTDAELKRVKHRSTQGLYAFLYALRKWLVMGDSVREWQSLKNEDSDADIEDEDAFQEDRSGA